LREVDKSGGFLANMSVVGWRIGGSHRHRETLLLEGLAEVHKRIAKDIPNFDELVAKATIDHVPLEFEQFYPVRVVELVRSALHVAMQKIFTLPSATSPIDGSRCRAGGLRHHGQATGGYS
jgi:hypothetical protein